MRTLTAALLAASLTLALCPLPIHAAEQFTLKWSTADQRGITMHIETTLPDHAEVRFSLSRAYAATSDGKSETYSHEYFKEDGTVSQWREPRRIPTDDDAWAAGLRAHQDEMAALGPGMAFEIDSVDAHIEGTAYAYAHKTGERYGAREYPTLIAKIQDTELVGKSEIRARRPMMNAGTIPKRSMKVGGRSLEIGESYRLLGDRTPLMPSPGADGFDGIAGMVYMPAGTVVAVIGMMSQSGDPWYHVTLPARGGREGWINSIVLLADGAYRLSDDEVDTPAAAGAVDYRAEIVANVIDPCVREIARLKMPSIDRDQAVAILKTLQVDVLKEYTAAMVAEVEGLDRATRTLFYETGAARCIAAAGS